MLAAKDSKPVTSGERETTTTENEKSSVTSTPQPSGLGELAAIATAPAGRGQGAVQWVQVGSAPGADISEVSREGASRRLSPTLATRPIKYALEIWVELEVSPGVYGAPEDDSYGVDFAAETLNQAYPGCTGLYLDVAGHMVAFYGRKGHSKAGLLHEQGIQASQAIASIPTWMGCPATWRVKCVSVAEANEIVTACKRLERENWRRARWELQHRFSAMRLGSSLLAVAKPFQPQATSSSMLAAGLPHGPVGPVGPREDSQLLRLSELRYVGDPPFLIKPQMREKPLLTPPSQTARLGGDVPEEEIRVAIVVATQMIATAPIVRRRKKDGFSNKIQIPEFGGKKGHPQDVASAFRQWARCITYYRDYYEDSYLMPLVVSSLTGDASDVFDWTRSLTPGDPQDLSALLQMLREHYCGSFTFREQRNMVENLRQGAQEDATDFMIRVGTSVSNLDKDWQGQLSQAELESLQYEVSLNGVRQEIRHVLDSEIARRGPLTPHQMYEVVKKYETYVARNKRLEGQSSSPSAGQQKTSGQASNYKPRFHKTTAFAAKVEESEAPVDQRQEAQPTEEGNPSEAESSLDDDDGLYIPSYLEEAAPNDPVLQVRLARAMRAHEKETRRCYRCHQQGHLEKDCKEPEEKKRPRAPLIEGASFSQVGAGEDQAENPSARSSRASDKPSQVKGTPYLNPDLSVASSVPEIGARH